jgi:hypothetical protein
VRARLWRIACSLLPIAAFVTLLVIDRRMRK